MKEYLDQLRFILNTGSKRGDRTGTGTISVFGTQNRYDLGEGFPAVTTKRLFWKGVVHELLWFLSGSTNIKYLVDNGVNIWNDDAYRTYMKGVNQRRRFNRVDPYSKKRFIEKIKESSDIGLTNLGGLGPVYGKQWRKFSGDLGNGHIIKVVDQIKNLINGIKDNPNSRRHILTAWNASEIDRMGLPPCHVISQFYVHDNKLSCQMYQRSADMFLGAPFNIASYALLTHMIAQVCDLGVENFVHSIGDAHIYQNHLKQAKEQLDREPYELPSLWLNPDIKNIDDFKFEDIKLEDYKCHPAIKAPLSTGA